MLSFIALHRTGLTDHRLERSGRNCVVVFFKVGWLCLFICRYNYMMQSHVKPLHQKVSETSERLNEVSEKLANMERKLKVDYKPHSIFRITTNACA